MRRTDLPSSSRVLQLGSVGRQQRSQFGPRADGVVSFYFLFIYVLIDYSRATYLDHGENMYSPFPVRADGQRCCDRCFRKSCFDPNSWIGCSVAHITPFQYTSVSI